MIASRLCLTPETFSRTLHELTAQGLIEVQRRVIVIKNLEGLRHYGRGAMIAGP